MESRESISSGMSLHDELSEVDEADQLFGSAGFTLEDSAGNESDSAVSEK